MVVAKTLEAQTDLVRQLQARTVKRYYQAFVGNVERAGTVDEPMSRRPTRRTKMAVVENGQAGKDPLQDRRALYGLYACRECALETGRTHQIGVHMTHIGHPLVGDPVYGAGASR